MNDLTWIWSVAEGNLGNVTSFMTAAVMMTASGLGYEMTKLDLTSLHLDCYTDDECNNDWNATTNNTP